MYDKSKKSTHTILNERTWPRNCLLICTPPAEGQEPQFLKDGHPFTTIVGKVAQRFGIPAAEIKLPLVAFLVYIAEQVSSDSEISQCVPSLISCPPLHTLTGCDCIPSHPRPRRGGAHDPRRLGGPLALERGHRLRDEVDEKAGQVRVDLRASPQPPACAAGDKPGVPGTRGLLTKPASEEGRRRGSEGGRQEGSAGARGQDTPPRPVG